MVAAVKIYAQTNYTVTIPSIGSKDKFWPLKLLQIKARVNYQNSRRVPFSWRCGDSMLWVSV